MTLKFAHIGDLHHGQNQSVMANAPILNHIANRPDIGDLIICETGDDIETPSSRLFRTAKSARRQVYDRSREGVKIPGNHDLDISGMWKWWRSPDMWAEYVEDLTGRWPIYPQLTVVDDVAIIAMDTCTPPSGRWAKMYPRQALASGLLGDEQIQKCAAMVEEQKALGRQVMLLLHHCLSGGSVSLQLTDRHELGDALKAVGGVDVALTGHLHRKCEWSDVYGVRLLLSCPKTSEADGYRVVTWDGVEWGWEWVEVS